MPRLLPHPSQPKHDLRMFKTMHSFLVWELSPKCGQQFKSKHKSCNRSHCYHRGKNCKFYEHQTLRWCTGALTSDTASRHAQVQFAWNSSVIKRLLMHMNYFFMTFIQPRTKSEMYIMGAAVVEYIFHWSSCLHMRKAPATTHNNWNPTN